jgi:hypothetical protein
MAVVFSEAGVKAERAPGTRWRHALRLGSRMAAGGGGVTFSRATKEREREHGDKNLLCVVTKSTGPKILV